MMVCAALHPGGGRLMYSCFVSQVRYIGCFHKACGAFKSYNHYIVALCPLYRHKNWCWCQLFEHVLNFFLHKKNDICILYLRCFIWDTFIFDGLGYIILMRVEWSYQPHSKSRMVYVEAGQASVGHRSASPNQSYFQQILIRIMFNVLLYDVTEKYT